MDRVDSNSGLEGGLRLTTARQARFLFNLQRDSFATDRGAKGLAGVIERLANRGGIQNKYDAGPFFWVRDQGATYLAVTSHRYPGKIRVLTNTHEIMDFAKTCESDEPGRSWDLRSPDERSVVAVPMESEFLAEWDQLYTQFVDTPPY